MISLGDTVIVDVDLASAFKDFILKNDDVKFDNDALKDKILKANDDNFLMIRKKIGSFNTILSVDLVNDDLLRKYGIIG